MNAGKKWTKEEEAYLLEELRNNHTMEQIAETHERTLKGIILRIELLSYHMYLAKVPVAEILKRSKLTRTQLSEAIQRLAAQKPTKKTNIETELALIHKEIKEVKNMIRSISRSAVNHAGPA
jgi:Glu-tRNA(Gln) amidotransferase subunit E-like FAD-binding protein